MFASATAVGRGPARARGARVWTAIAALVAASVLAALLVASSRAPAVPASRVGDWTATIDDVGIDLRIEPLHLGTNLFRVELRSAGRALTTAENVTLQVAMLDMDMGERTVFLAPLGQGVYAGKADVLGMAGNWRLRLLVPVRGQPERSTTFYVHMEP